MDKEKALENAMRQIEKDFGKGSIMKMGEKTTFTGNVIPTGNYMINKALGIGGWPKGRSVEIYGMESSGKTTLALHAVAECQKQGGTAAYIDVEHAVDLEYARALGVDVDSVIFSQPSYGEEALDILIALIESKAIDLIIVDSVAMLTPKAEIEGSMEDNQIGLQARMLGKAARKIVASVSNNNVCVIWINQIRFKTNVTPHQNPETRPAGKALDFLTSIMVKIGKTQTETDKSGHGGKITVPKNKCAPPFKQAEFDLVFGKGISNGLVDAAVEAEIIEKAASWYRYKDNRWQGKDNVENAINSNPKLKKEIEDALNDAERKV